jgi:zinc protease
LGRYGKTSLYARVPRIANIAALSVQDARQFLSTWERPDNAIMGVVGDFEPKAMAALLERELGQWKSGPDQPVVPPQVGQVLLSC